MARWSVVAVVAVLAMMVASSFATVASASGGAPSSPAHARPYVGPLTTPESVKFTGSPATDFPADSLLYTNLFTPWGSANNFTDLYGTWNSTQLFLGLSTIVVNGNNLLIAVSNNSAWGTTNLSALTGVAKVGQWNRTIDFTQPINYLFIVNSSGVPYFYEVTSQATATTTTVVSLTPAASDLSVTYNKGNNTWWGTFEVALNFSTIFPVFPKFANVSLYAGIFGGSGGYIGPTIPSGQTYDDTYSSSNPAYYLTSHDRPGGYALENTFYKLQIDPTGTGAPGVGITPNYIVGDAFHTVKFTGNPSTDFAPGEQALINTNTMWGGSNLLNSSYITWNETTLFLGFESFIQSNYFYFFIGNDTGSSLGTYTLNTTNATSLDRPILFTQAVNFIGVVHFAAANVFSPVYLYKVNSSASKSNTTVTVENVTSSISGTSMVTAGSTEIAIPFNLLYGRPASWPVLGQFANVSVVAAVVGGSGPSTGPTLPAGQGYAYTGYYNTNHVVGQSELLNTFFTENLDPYGDSFPAPQINPTYTYGHTYHSVKFTGTVTNDFVAPEIVGVNTTTPWGPNWVNDTYATWNYTDLFVGTDSYVSSGNWMLVAISNNTGVGATNFSHTNVKNLTRNFEFSTPINFVFEYAGGAPNGSLYEVNLKGTNSTSTNFTFLESVPRGTDGFEFAIPFSTMYPDQPSAAGADAVAIGATPQLVAFIYGGPGAYIGPTIPNGQSFSSATAFAPIDSYVTLNIDPKKDGYAEPGIVPSAPLVVYKGNPISLNIIFNDHQPLYGAIGSTYQLPWAVVHLEEYAEQALIAGLFPEVNITYSLSGSLLYQIDAVAHGDYVNSYLQAAEIPSSQWNNSVYTEVTTDGDTFLDSFVPTYQQNTTTVAQVLEYDLAFNTPLWVYTAPTAASTLYDSLFILEQGDHALSTAQLTDALAEYFLWSTSYPIVTGQLGASHINSTMWAFYNDSSFSISDINTIAGYYPVEAQLTLSAFEHDRMLNDGKGGNVELITTPFNHPLMPLLLLNNWTDENGAAITKGVWTSDAAAELDIGAQLYNQTFGQMPLGLWSPEQAVSAAMIPLINDSGYAWTSSSQATLAEAGISVPGSGAVTAQQMENLYTPYKVTNGTAATVMVFRDDSLSNDWGFNYGGVASTMGNWAAVGDFMTYLKGVYATVPRADHASTLVTVALDGENWMFMSPFPEDAVPFLKDVYIALEQNSSWVATATTQQFLATSPTLPTISSLPTGSWNAEPSGTGINQYLGQWAGHNLQDATWEQLTLVRSDVLAYGQTNGLTQPNSLATLEKYNNFPYLNEWNTSTNEGKYVEAWMALYGAEGSDLYFAFDPADQSPTAQNALVFEQVFRSDLTTALTILGLPLTPFLESSYQVPITPTTWGTNASITPALTGSLYTTQTFPSGTGYSVNHNDAWAGSYVKSTGDTTSGASQISQVNYAFDVSNLYLSVQVNGATSAYKSPNFYTPATDSLNVYFSPINPQPGNLQSLGVPNSVYTVGTTPFGFAATTEVTIEGNSITPTGSATLGVFGSTASETWSSVTTVAGDAFVGNLLQLQVPYADLNGMVPGDSITFFVAVVNSTSGAPLSWVGPMEVTVPASLAKLTLISTIHNTAADNGPGWYTYPTGESAGVKLSPFPFPPQSFDMQWFNVSMNPYTVQFNVTFGNLSNVYGGSDGFSQPIIDIYIHEPGAGAGNTSGLAGTGVNIATQSAWQWAIQASGYPANNYIESAATHVENPAPVLVSTNLGEGSGTNGAILPHKTVSIEVPTSIIGTAIGTYSYVIIAGSQDGYGVNGWRIVDNISSEYQGGGAPSAVFTAGYSTNVYSYIAPAVVNEGTLTQQQLLANMTTKHYATLVGITLPLLVTKKTVTAVLGPSAIVNNSADPMALYALGSEVYSSTSTDGMTWTTPSPVVNLSFVPTGLAAAGGAYPAFVAWNGTSTVFEDLTTHAFTNTTAPGAVEAGSVTYNGGFVVAYDIAGTVYVGSPSSISWGSDAVSAVAIGLATANGVTYLAYATATGLSVVTVTLGASSASFSSSTVLTSTLPTGATAESLAVAAAPTGAVAVVLALKNATGTNVFLAVGTGTVTMKALTDDGQDSSPSVLLAEVGGVWEAYVGFTNSATSGNVYFLPSPVASVTKTTAPSPSPSVTPSWVWYAVGAVVVLVIVILLVALLMRRRKGREPTSTTPTGPTPPAPSEPSTPLEPSPPPSTGGGNP